jgi:hypothetical protein
VDSQFFLYSSASVLSAAPPLPHFLRFRPNNRADARTRRTLTTDARITDARRETRDARRETRDERRDPKPERETR